MAETIGHDGKNARPVSAARAKRNAASSVSLAESAKIEPVNSAPRQQPREWVCFIMSKMLNLRDPNIWRVDFDKACSPGTQMRVAQGKMIERNGDWYLFIRDPKWKLNYAKMRSCRFIVTALSAGNGPYLFTNSEVMEFCRDINTKRTKAKGEYGCGDLVQVKTGYLENLYGVVLRVRRNRAVVFFSFYTRSFYETIDIRDMKKVGTSNFCPTRKNVANQCVMGVQNVFTGKVRRGKH